MPEKPTRASDYPSEQVELVRSTCLYVATKLGDLVDDVVVVGGLVPSLLMEQAVEIHGADVGLNASLQVSDLGLGFVSPMWTRLSSPLDRETLRAELLDCALPSVALAKEGAAAAKGTGMPTPDDRPAPSSVSLTVYAPRPDEEGDCWNKDYGLLIVPDDWERLPAGDAYLTRTVKKLGPCWVLRKKNRKRRYTTTLGLYAPAGNIRRAREMADETRAAREKRKGLSAKARARREEKYRSEFRRAVLEYLDLAPEHAKLAAEIADGVVDHACPVGSGTVARTSKLDLEEKVHLAVRAYVRHRHTDYEETLGGPFSDWYADDYRGMKALANMEAEEFLEKHRRPGRR